MFKLPDSPRNALKARLLLIGAAAALTILAFDPINISPLAWVSLVPLFLVLRDAGPKAAFRLGLLYGVLVFAVSLHWIVRPFTVFGLVLAPIPAAFVALFCVLHVLARQRSGVAWLILTPVFWTGIELFRSELWPLRFSWLSPACSQHSLPAVIQIASVFGCYSVSFAIVAANLLVAEFLSNIREHGAWRYLTAACAVPVFLVCFGLAVSGGYAQGGVQFAAVQSEEGLDSLLELSKRHLDSGSRPDIVVWPEYSVRTYYVEDDSAKKAVQEFCKGNELELVFGTFEPALGRPGFYNVVYLVDPDGRIAGRYVKAYPVPFFNDGIPGKGRKPVVSKLGRLGLLICYDLGFPEVARNLTANGAQVLIVPTMDPYSWGAWEHYQHAAVAPLRAVETRRWVVRAASSGLSMLIAPDGSVQRMLPYGREGVLSGEFAMEEDLSLYVRFGFLFAYACLTITVGAGLLWLYSHLRARRNSSLP